MGRNGRCLTNSKKDRTFDIRELRAWSAKLHQKYERVFQSDIIFKQRAAKKAKISEEMSLVAYKYSENDPVPCSIDDLSVTEIRDELKKIGVKTWLKKQRKTYRPFKE
jgi:hypothetical protein